jgi:hypothetical protein
MPDRAGRTVHYRPFSVASFGISVAMRERGVRTWILFTQRFGISIWL